MRTRARVGLLGSVILLALAVAPSAMAAGLRIASFSPRSGPVGRKVTIAGTGFSASDTVTLGGQPAPIVSVTPTRIQVAVPPLAVTGTITVTDPTGLRVTSAAPFQVTAGLSATPQSVWPGGTFRLAASGLTPDQVLPVTLKIGKKALIVADLRTDQNGNSDQNVAVPDTLGPGRARLGVLDPNAGSLVVSILLIADWRTFHHDTLHEGAGSAPLVPPLVVGTLQKKWSFGTGGAVTSSPAVWNNTVYFGSADHFLYAVNATTGTLEWRFGTASAIVSSPTVANGLVYFGSMGGGLYALNATTGSVEWVDDMDGSVEGSPEVVGTTLWVTTTNDDINVYALDEATGTILHGSGDDGIGTLTTRANGETYQWDDTLTAFHLSAQNLIIGDWTGPVVGDATHPTPAVVGNRVYATAPDGTVEVFPVAAGTNGASVLPTMVLSTGSSSPISSSIAVDGNGSSYFGAPDGSLFAFSGNGTFQWARDLGAPIDSSPAIADGVIYVGSEDDSLYAVKQSNGLVLWNYATGGEVESSPAVANNMVFVGSDDGSLYAFGLP